MRRTLGLIAALLILCLPGMSEAQSCDGCGIGYRPATVAVNGSTAGFQIYIPDQTLFPGSMAVGTGGTHLINSGPFSHTGEGSEFFGLEAGDSNTDAAYNTFVGYRAGKRATTGSQNTFMGMAAGEYMVSGTGNTFIGAFAGQNATGDYNVIIGTDAGNEFTTAQDSVAIGRNAGGEVKTGNGNTYIGADAGSANESGTGNTCIGMFCLLLGTGTNNIALGYTAGRWETGNYKLFIDGYSRNDEADARAKSLIYGVMGANVADQTLYVNGFLTPTAQLRAVSGSGAAPGMSFSGDSTTGLTLVAGGIVDFSAGGTSRYRLTGTSINPLADMTYDLGAAPANKWRSLFLGTSSQGSRSKALTDNTATAFVRLSVADDDYEGCGVIYTAYAEDTATDARQTRTGSVHMAILNNSGTETAAFSTGDSAVVVTAGTFTCTFDGNSGAADTIDLRATCDTSLAATTTLTFEYRLDCPSTVTVTPQ